MKSKCAVIGKPINHSLSPVIHTAGYQQLHLNFTYEALEFDKAKKAISYMKEKNYRGFSVTLPLKIEIMQYLDEITPLANEIGAVNTIVNRDGKLYGYNTDAIGAIRSIKETMNLKGKNIHLIGAGGAARAIAHALLKERVEELTIVNRSVKNGKKLAEAIGSQFIHLQDYNPANCDLIINTTPVGMKPNSQDTVLETFLEGITVMDIVYTPLVTRFLHIAKKYNCKLIPGWKMLLYQAIEQFELFTGKQAPVKKMEESLKRALSNE